MDNLQKQIDEYFDRERNTKMNKPEMHKSREERNKLANEKTTVILKIGDVEKQKQQIIRQIQENNEAQILAEKRQH